ncbi:hypothetical protein AAE02nite_08020 [Adhaeribacter aerolatus]|uniref:Uncharacterized protein n=1 Tax=Adhaeribacter aerolatus TaxID=670289 RepID=A0A512ATV6_9BACT|nr:hypothetical protein [Adhaeribacter aerolatus]GEO03138.1 hypothetical protein AAE02nite_08020 [Adhaeribacter aerolatus]
MLLEISKYLDVVPPFLLLLFALASAPVTFRQDYIFWYLAVQTLLNTISKIIYLGYNGSNLVVYNINCVLSFLILSAYFASILQFKDTKKVVTGVLALFLMVLIFNALQFENIIDQFNSNMYGLAAFIVVVYAFLYYLQNLLNPTKNIVKSVDFWYVTGLLTYYASSFFIFITFNYLMQSNSKYDSGIRYLWPIHNVLFLVMCGYFFKGMLCRRSQMI